MIKKLGIIGVVILLILILFIASITYSYVESIRNKTINEITDYLDGTITDLHENNTILFKNKNYQKYTVTLRNNNNETNIYNMVFYNLYPPHEEISFRLYYDLISQSDDNVYRIVRVDIL